MPRANRGLHTRFRDDRNSWGVAEFVKGRLKWRSTGHGSQRDAERELGRLLLQEDTKTSVHRQDQRVIADVLASYILEHGPETLHPKNLTYACENLAPFWAEKTVSEISKAACQRYCEARRIDFEKWQKKKQREAKKLSNATLRLELATLKAALNHDHQARRLESVPSVWMPPKPAARDRWLTRSEVAALLRAARRAPVTKDYLPLFILVALYTGARKEAVLSLRWPQVDFKRERIDFRNSDQGKGRAVVPIPRKLMVILSRVKKSDLGYVIHRSGPSEGRKSRARDGISEKRVKDVKKGFREACELAKIEGVTPHTLRHTAASWMVQKGVPLFDVARWLGHTSTIMVEKTYGHMAPEHLERARKSWG